MILDELAWRGAIAQSTDLAALRAAMNAGPITAYCGFDPTAPSLHFGNFVQLTLLRRLQRAGHQVICLVGGSTGLIGDPKPNSERALKTKEDTAADAARIKSLVRPFLDFEGRTGQPPALLVDNLEWTEPLSALDFLREVGKHFRVNQMIKKDAIAVRLASLEGISYTEFSYQLLQALDYLHLFRTYGCTLQTGGSDQWGNLTAGVDLVHRVMGVEVHALTTPLLTDANGVKFGKSEGNAVWLSADLTSPYAFYQYFLNVEDASVIRLLKFFTDLTQQQIATLADEVTSAPARRSAQRTLATEVTTLVHGDTAAAMAKAASEALFGRGDIAALDQGTLLEATRELPGAPVAAGTALLDAMVAVGLSDSKKAARRVLADGGLSVNGQKVTSIDAVLGASDFLHGQVALLRRGRRAQAVARIAPEN